MTAEWPRVQLREVAQLASRWVRPEPGTPYRQLGVRLHGLGAYERETIDGSETKYAVLNEVRAGDLVVNKIWAREGSAAVITPDLDGCFVSGEFPTYELDTAVLMSDGSTGSR